MYGKSKLEIWDNWENWANFEWGQTGKKKKANVELSLRELNSSHNHATINQLTRLKCFQPLSAIESLQNF